MTYIPLQIAGLLALAVLGLAPTAASAQAEGAPCADCLTVRVGPPVVVRGPFPDELDATFTALKLADGTFRGFSANGATYAIDGASLPELSGAWVCFALLFHALSVAPNSLSTSERRTAKR